MLKRFLFVAVFFLPGIACASSCGDQILDAQSRLISATLLGRIDRQAEVSAELLELANTPEELLDIANQLLTRMKDWNYTVYGSEIRLSLLDAIRRGFSRFEFEASLIDDFQKRIVETVRLVRSPQYDRLFSILFGSWSKDPSPRLPISNVAFETRKLLLNVCWRFGPEHVASCYEKLLGRGDLTGPQYYPLMTLAVRHWLNSGYSDFDYFYHAHLNTGFADSVSVLISHVKRVTPRDLGKETELKRTILGYSEAHLDWGAEVYGRYAKDLPTIDYRVPVRRMIEQW